MKISSVNDYLLYGNYHYDTLNLMTTQRYGKFFERSFTYGLNYNKESSLPVSRSIELQNVTIKYWSNGEKSSEDLEYYQDFLELPYTNNRQRLWKRSVKYEGLWSLSSWVIITCLWTLLKFLIHVMRAIFYLGIYIVDESRKVKLRVLLTSCFHLVYDT